MSTERELLKQSLDALAMLRTLVNKYAKNVVVGPGALDQGIEAYLDSAFEVIHLKTGNKYLVTGKRINATNDQDGQVMIEYERNNQKYSREIGEFFEKFERLEACSGF